MSRSSKIVTTSPAKGDELMISKRFSIAMMIFLTIALVVMQTVTTQAQGRFRVTFTGFVVNHDTTESVLSIDGAGDEVYVLANFAEMWSSNRIFGALQRRQSLTYGDTAGRSGPVDARNLGIALIHPTDFSTVQLGTMSSTGGLKTGNQYPPPEGQITRPNAREAARARMFPMVLWEGELRDNGPQANAVLLMPTIWESDNVPDVLNIWNRQADDYIRRFATHAEQYISLRTRRPLVEQFETVLNTIPQRNDFDRPIGMGGGAFNPSAASPEPATFIPAVMLLTFNSANTAALSTTYGPGVVKIDYADGPNYGQGNYTIFLRVERLQ
jgi:hypothetical protein